MKTLSALFCEHVRRAHHLVETALTTDLHTLRARDDVIYQEYGPAEGRAGKQLQRIWYAQRLEGGKMERVTLMDCNPDGAVHRVSQKRVLLASRICGMRTAFMEKKAADVICAEARGGRMEGVVLMDGNVNGALHG